MMITLTLSFATNAAESGSMESILNNIDVRTKDATDEKQTDFPCDDERENGCEECGRMMNNLARLFT